MGDRRRQLLQHGKAASGFKVYSRLMYHVYQTTSFLLIYSPLPALHRALLPDNGGLVYLNK